MHEYIRLGVQCLNCGDLFRWSEVTSEVKKCTCQDMHVYRSEPDEVCISSGNKNDHVNQGIWKDWVALPNKLK